jgi:hypothetical protein
MTLNNVFNDFGTDKGDRYNAAHNYAPIYEQIFEDLQVENLLEIGIENGHSHQAWAEYFSEAMIYGADRSPIDLDHFRIMELTCDQNDIDSFFTAPWQSLPLMDIIIDDGGHCMNHHAITLAALWHKVRPGGYYVIEDVHTCNYPKGSHLFGQPVMNDIANTLLTFRCYLISIDKSKHMLDTPFPELRQLDASSIERVRIVGDNNTDTMDIENIKKHGLIIIKKKA